MAAFVKFDCFVENEAEKVHNLGSDTLKLALTNTAPTAATDTVLDTVTKHPPPAAANGYPAGGEAVTITSSAQSGGTYKLVGNSVVFTATAGGIGPFRYIILYNSSASDALIGYWDYGSSTTLPSAGDTLTVTLSPTNGILQAA
jgi:hypothetical protein